MTDNRDAFFDRMRGAYSKPEAEESRQIGFENSTVRQIIRAAGAAPASWRQAEDECRQKYGSPELTFEWLHEAYPGCPVVFGAEKLRRTHTVSLDDLFNRFTKTVIFKGYQEFLARFDLRDSEVAVAFVFNWRSARHAMVLHNIRPESLELVDDAEQGGTAIVHRRAGSHVVYSIEPLTKFVARIKDVWIRV